MENNTDKNNFDKRSEPRQIIEQYHNVEISIEGMAPVYVFRLRDISSSGLGILVREDSGFLSQIEVGQILDVKFNPMEPSTPPRNCKTEIRHITKATQEQPEGHVIIGLLIIENIEP